MKLVQDFGNFNYSINNISYINVIRDKNFVFPYKNGKEFHSFIVPESGSMEYHFFDNDKTLRLEKGSFLYIPKKLPYSATYLEDSTTISIFVFDAPLNELPEYMQNPFVRHMPSRSECFDNMTRLDTQSGAFVAARIYDLIYSMEKSDKSVADKYAKILPAIVDIKKQHFENHKISYYADMCNMSESNFRKLFREYTGTSPIEYRNIIRAYRVKSLLDSGEFTVSEAAYIAGFNNMSFFYEVYNRIFK